MKDREIDILSNENGVVRFRIRETGTEMTLPQSMDPARVEALIDGHVRAVQRRPQMGGVTDNRTRQEVAQDQAAAVITSVPKAITQLPAAAGGAAALILKALQAAGRDPEAARTIGPDIANIVRGAARPVGTLARGAGALIAPSMVQAPTSQEFQESAEAAGTNLGATALGAGASKALSSIPSMARAGGRFEQVMGRAQNVPLNLTEADAVAARALELKQAGSSMPKVIKDFINRQKQGTPMTYREGRDFASNASALSAREATRVNAKMQRQVVQFSKAMKEANREAAESVGMGKMYDAAMKEFRQAASLSDAAAVLKKWAGRAAAAAALGGAGAAGYSAYRELTGN